MSNRQQFVYYDRLTEIPSASLLAVNKQKEQRMHLTVRHNKVVHGGKHLLPGIYFKRFIVNGGAPWGTSFLTRYERRGILFMLFASIPLRSIHRHLRVLEAFVKN